jgi:hypothetical protein
MNTLTIHHDLIGAYPELADFDLSAEIQSFKSVKELLFRLWFTLCTNRCRAVC